MEMRTARRCASNAAHTTGLIDFGGAALSCLQILQKEIRMGVVTETRTESALS
jgi:hypothetical protein